LWLTNGQVNWVLLVLTCPYLSKTLEKPLNPVILPQEKAPSVRLDE